MVAPHGFTQRWKGAIAGTARSLFQFGKGLGSPISVSGFIDSQVSSAGIGTGADTTEDVLFTFSLPANSLDQNGRGVAIRVFGSLANNAHTKTVKMYFGSSVTFTPINGTQANIGFDLQMTVIRTASGVQIANAGGTMGVATVLATLLPIVGADPDTAAIVIKVTGQTATAAANDVVANAMLTQGFN